jgi:hypothetical protein
VSARAAAADFIKPARFAENDRNPREGDKTYGQLPLPSAPI